MAVTIAADSQRDQREYEQAWQCLAAGRLAEGAQRLGAIAGRTGDAALRSQCFYNLGEVLEKLGRCDEAYRVWYRQAHKAPELRQPFDVTARLRVMRMFEQQALRLVPPDFPPQIQIEVTNRCNLRCIMCTRNQMTRKLGDMSFETFRKIADEWSREPFVGLRIYFLGEPLLHPELERMIAYAASVTADRPSAGPFGIQTNGMLLTRDRARSLLEAGLWNFAISLDGLAGDLERIRRGASYPVVEKNVCDLIELGRDMGIENLVVDITKLSDDPEGDEVRRFREVWGPRVRHVLVSGINK
ncbi:MAG: radical SAM protein, partial [Phycisphaerales bacterium]